MSSQQVSAIDSSNSPKGDAPSSYARLTADHIEAHQEGHPGQLHTQVHPANVAALNNQSSPLFYFPLLSVEIYNCPKLQIGWYCG